MKALTAIFILLLQLWIAVFFKTFAQGNVQTEWVRNYAGADSSVEPNAITADNSGNVYVTGHTTTDSTYWDYITIKYDPDGSEKWISYYNGSANLSDEGLLISTDYSRNVYVCGNSLDSSYNSDIATIKYNPDGTEQWVKRYNGSENNCDDHAAAMAVDSSGNIYILGSGRDTTEFDFTIIKYNTDGIEQWSNRYNDYEVSWDIPEDLIIDDSGNVYVTGSTDRGVNVLNDFLTIKFNSGGSLQWKAYYGDRDSNDVANTITTDRIGNVYVSGISNGNYTTVKYDVNGTEQWVRTHGSYDNSDFVHDITTDKNNNIYITGENRGAAAGIATIKYNSDGLELWAARYDSLSEFPLGIKVNNQGEVYVVGKGFRDFAGSDFLIVKYDSAGMQEWVEYYNSDGNHEDETRSFFIDELNNIYLTGITGELDFWGMLWEWSNITTIKYSEVPAGLIREVNDILPGEYILYQNYPNPFNPETIINYSVPEQSKVSIIIYDALGKKLSTLVNKELPEGSYSVEFNADSFSSGIYFYQMKTENYINTKKMVLIR